VEEVPLPQPSLLVLDDQQALSLKHQKRLLSLFGVVLGRWLAGLEHVNVDPEVRELVRGVLERPRMTGILTGYGFRLRDVDDEPPFTVGS